MAKKTVGIDLTDKEILKTALAERGLTQGQLGERIGMIQTAVSGNMNRGRMSLGMFRKLLEAMDYDVCVVDRETGEIKWTVTE